MRALIAGLTCLLVVGCGGAATPQATTPPGPAATAAEPAPPPAPALSPALPPSPEAVPPAPTECGALISRPAAPAECGSDAASTVEALAAGLLEAEPAARDAALFNLEACPGIRAGLVRGLRAELAPVACGDTLIGDFLDHSPGKLEPLIRDALVGLALAGRLHRLVRNPPVITPPFTKARFGEFLAGPLGSWVRQQAKAINDIAVQGAALEGYGKGVTAVEAGLADMRFVEVVREVPLPQELARDQELSDVYYMALDEALGPRKDRGRDAALVGLKLLADVGVLNDPRVRRARELLSKLYSGRRIDTLDGLMLPALPPVAPDAGQNVALAQALPTFYAGFILADVDPSAPEMLRALLARGIPAGLRKRLDASPLPLEARRLYARALVESGQHYWRSADFTQAASISQLGSDGKGEYADETRLLAALASALQGGPKDAAEMMLRGPFLPAGVGNVKGLDSIARSKSPFAGLAAFDAAFILQLVPPVDPDPAFWKDLSKRYERAAKLLPDAERKARAQEQASAARDTAKAIGEN